MTDSRSIDVTTNDPVLFLLVANIPLYIYIDRYHVFIHASVTGLFGS